MSSPMKATFFLMLSQLLLASTTTSAEFTVEGSRILRDGEDFEPFGINAMNTHEPLSKNIDTHGLKNMKVVREAIIMDDQPLRCHKKGCFPETLCTGVELHPLQPLLERNAQDDIVTIVDLHQWNVTTEFAGKIPSQVGFADQYLRKLTEYYVPFLEDFTDSTWLSLWNEPFAWDGSDNISPEAWMMEMDRIVQAVRTAGYTGVIVVPVGQEGEDETVLLHGHAQALAQNYGPIVYDIHVYNRWLSASAEHWRERLTTLQKEELAVMLGAVGPSTAHHHFIGEAVQAKVGVVFGTTESTTVAECPTLQMHFAEAEQSQQ